jgi:hypothetical protein
MIKGIWEEINAINGPKKLHFHLSFINDLNSSIIILLGTRNNINQSKIYEYNTLNNTWKKFNNIKNKKKIVLNRFASGIKLLNLKLEFYIEIKFIYLEERDASSCKISFNLT